MVISILDYDSGNLRSITNVMDFLDKEYKIISTGEEVSEAEKVVLPGVGHFGQLMEHLYKNNLIDSLKTYIFSGRPYLGICLGMQILFESSEEAPGEPGLAIFQGNVLKFTTGKVPQIGWNKLEIHNHNHLLKPDYVYFVNSYHVQTEQKEIIAAKTNYHVDFVSAVQRNKLLAVQFHPEKSGEVGLNIIKRWLEYVD